MRGSATCQRTQPSSQLGLLLGLRLDVIQALESEFGLEVELEPLVIALALGFQQAALLGIIAVVLHTLAVAADLVGPSLGRTRHLRLVGASLLGHAGVFWHPLAGPADGRPVPAARGHVEDGDGTRPRLQRRRHRAR
jgi:hypothetical protein